MKYTSKSQIARIETEKWAINNLFCPLCGNAFNDYSANTKVYDFICSNCNQEYQLKAMSKKIGKKLIGSEYYTFINAIENKSVPNFLIMEYSIENDCFKSKEVIFVPKVFITEEVIEKRKPLSESARRAGWTGYNLLFEPIPSYGKLHIVKNGILQSKNRILKESQKITNLYNIDSNKVKWKIEILKILDSLDSVFTLQEIYNKEIELQELFPDNNHIKDKIRQQLQFIRDDGVIVFHGNGKYEKT
ncbi:DpnI domain-containing protein [Acinetobacter sp. UBA801]|uniref:DpnI domain-containing protein n=1 Tax=Acinetobacter sp. UBA801 TaxID=1945958 RepID=UPI0025BD4E81|nr:DpnI domain-containing protein [Acinetobacter sp. UBA801]